MVRIHPGPPEYDVKRLFCWGISSVGRAPALQAGGQRFDPAILHQTKRKIKVYIRIESIGA